MCEIQIDSKPMIGSDTRGKPWAGIPHAVLDTLLTCIADLRERPSCRVSQGNDGYNMGAIALSQRQIAERLTDFELQAYRTEHRSPDV